MAKWLLIGAGTYWIFTGLAFWYFGIDPSPYSERVALGALMLYLVNEKR